LLSDGYAVTVVTDLKVKGSASMLKIGTKVKNIGLVAGDHNIDCKMIDDHATSSKPHFFLSPALNYAVAAQI